MSPCTPSPPTTPSHLSPLAALEGRPAAVLLIVVNLLSTGERSPDGRLSNLKDALARVAAVHAEMMVSPGAFVNGGWTAAYGALQGPEPPTTSRKKSAAAAVASTPDVRPKTLAWSGSVAPGQACPARAISMYLTGEVPSGRRH